MTWDEGSRYDASRVGLWETAAMAAISGILVTVGAWPWPMIGAFLAAGSLLLIGHTQIGLENAGCTHVAMEATGVYWKPVWHILEGHFVLILANAAHVKNVPGRKSDVNDATWLGDLLAHGLIRSSFVPPPEIQELRGPPGCGWRLSHISAPAGR
jgi:Transposase